LSPLALRRSWRAASTPGDFFADLPDAPRVASATIPALLSVAAGALILAWAIARATSSDAWLPILLLVVPGLLIYSATLWLLGGLVLSRAAELDLRGWEIAAWAWVPTGFLALSLLPVVAVFPVTSLMLGTLGLPVWHLTVVHAGLARFAPAGGRRALLLYALVILAAPLTVMGVTLLAILAGAEASGKLG
jgi:hypothetical protein